MKNKTLKDKLSDMVIQREKMDFLPVFFNLSKALDCKKVEDLIKKGKIVEIVDEFAEQEKELYLSKHPEEIFSGVTRDNKFKMEEGIWVYYPWKYSLVHLLSPKEYNNLRMSRNYNLILPEEQKKLSGITIGVVGLNVGNPGAVCLALESAGSFFKLAELDELSVSNLNRFRAGVSELGLNKGILTARQIVEIDPFVKVEVLDKGVNEKNIDDFLLQPKIDVLIEEMDNLKLKIYIREKAKKFGIPVLMVTGNGENIIADVERYDLDKNLPILNGLLPIEISAKISKGNLVGQEKVDLARSFIGENILSSRLVESFAEVGKKLAGIPQLSEASFLRGAILTHLVRRLVVGGDLKSGRYHLKPGKILN